MVDERLQEVDAEDVWRVEHGHGHALEPSAEVDVALRQLLEPVGGPAVLHEHRVPDLDVAAAVAVRVTDGAEGGVVDDLLEEVEHLRVGSPGLAHGHGFGCGRHCSTNSSSRRRT